MIFTLLALLATVGIQDMPEQMRILNFDRNVLLSIVASLSASGAFFLVVESFRSWNESIISRDADRLKKIEETLGIKGVFTSKSQAEAIAEYKKRINDAKSRIWAVGLSNNQFLEQHSAVIKVRKQSHPFLDVRVFFFDPDALVSSVPANLPSHPLINLFDFPKQVYMSEKRANDARHFAQRIIADTATGATVHFALIPSYFSLMIVDDIAFFFPYLMAPEDASSNPMMMVDTKGEIGSRLVEHVQQLLGNPLLCRQVTAPSA